MSNKNLIQNYKSEVLHLFKTLYKKMITKQVEIDFKMVFDEMIKELRVTDYQEEDIQFIKDWFCTIHNQEFIKPILEIQGYNEVIIHSNQRAQLVFHNNKKTIEIPNLSIEDFQLSLEVFAIRNNVSWNFSSPFVSFSTSIQETNFRVTLIHHSTSANKLSKLFLRKIQNDSPTLKLFSENDFLNSLLVKLIHDKKNILVSGGTGSGKTTFLRALLKEIPTDEHIVVLEDTHEIMEQNPHYTNLLSSDDFSKKSLKDYCSYALRMSPDRLIVGEMRSTEVVPFMLAMNTGHSGLMSTIHANTAVDAIARIALLFSLYSESKDIDFKLINKLACKNIHYVIHMENKRVKEVCKIIGSEGENPFYERIYDNSEGLISA